MLHTSGRPGSFLRIRWGSVTAAEYQKDLEEIINGYGQISNARIYQGRGIFTFYEASIDMDTASVSDLNWDIDTHPNLCVHSLGRQIKIYKDEGSAEDLQTFHKVNNHLLVIVLAYFVNLEPHLVK